MISVLASLCQKRRDYDAVFVVQAPFEGHTFIIVCFISKWDHKSENFALPSQISARRRPKKMHYAKILSPDGRGRGAMGGLGK